MINIEFNCIGQDIFCFLVDSLQSHVFLDIGVLFQYLTILIDSSSFFNSVTEGWGICMVLFYDCLKSGVLLVIIFIAVLLFW